MRNHYFESVKAISDQVRLHPDDPLKWAELANLTKNSDEWYRYYAYCFLAELSTDKIGNQSGLCIPLFVVGVRDSKQHIRHRCVLAIKDVGGVAVDAAYDPLSEILRKRVEDDITWTAAEAMSKITQPNLARKAMKELLEIAAQPQKQGTDPNAPQLRYFALESAKNLFIAHFQNTDDEDLFEELLDGADVPFRSLLCEVIKEIEVARMKK